MRNLNSNMKKRALVRPARSTLERIIDDDSNETGILYENLTLICSSARTCLISVPATTRNVSLQQKLFMLGALT